MLDISIGLKTIWAINMFHRKSPANAKGNARQRCMYEGTLRTKFKLTSMFYLDSTADDA